MSFTALARAELANGLADAARISIDKALRMPIKSADLFFTASRIYEGDAAASASYLARAKTMNPRIAPAAKR